MAVRPGDCCKMYTLRKGRVLRVIPETCGLNGMGRDAMGFVIQVASRVRILMFGQGQRFRKAGRCSQSYRATHRWPKKSKLHVHLLTTQALFPQLDQLHLRFNLQPFIFLFSLPSLFSATTLTASLCFLCKSCRSSITYLPSRSLPASHVQFCAIYFFHLRLARLSSHHVWISRQRRRGQWFGFPFCSASPAAE